MLNCRDAIASKNEHMNERTVFVGPYMYCLSIGPSVGGWLGLNLMNVYLVSRIQKSGVNTNTI